MRTGQILEKIQKKSKENRKRKCLMLSNFWQSHKCCNIISEVFTKQQNDTFEIVLNKANNVQTALLKHGFHENNVICINK